MVVEPTLQKGEGTKAQTGEVTCEGSMAFGIRAGTLSPILLQQGEPDRNTNIDEGPGACLTPGVHNVLWVGNVFSHRWPHPPSSTPQSDLS